MSGVNESSLVDFPFLTHCSAMPVTAHVVLVALTTLAVAASAAHENVTVHLTFYGSKDNCPPGGDIQFPHLHKLAGGKGTFADPITFAGAKEAVAPGTIVYVHYLKKYFIMEDSCQECVENWKKDKRWHMDLWIGSDKVTPGDGLIACEDALTGALHGMMGHGCRHRRKRPSRPTVCTAARLRTSLLDVAAMCVGVPCAPLVVRLTSRGRGGGAGSGGGPSGGPHTAF